MNRTFACAEEKRGPVLSRRAEDKVHHGARVPAARERNPLGHAAFVRVLRWYVREGAGVQVFGMCREEKNKKKTFVLIFVPIDGLGTA